MASAMIYHPREPRFPLSIERKAVLLTADERGRIRGTPMAAPEHNQQVAALFRSIAELLAAHRANPYRVRAYRRGADALLALNEDVADVARRNALEEIDGIGSD